MPGSPRPNGGREKKWEHARAKGKSCKKGPLLGPDPAEIHREINQNHKAAAGGRRDPTARQAAAAKLRSVPEN